MTLASDLQYSDPTVTSFLGDTQVDPVAKARLDLLMNSDEAHATFNAQGEIKSALGATIILPRWDTDINDHVWLDHAAADTAIPVFRHGRLVEVTLWSEYLEGHVYWRHLERHAPVTSSTPCSVVHSPASARASRCRTGPRRNRMRRLSTVAPASRHSSADSPPATCRTPPRCRGASRARSRMRAAPTSTGAFRSSTRSMRRSTRGCVISSSAPGACSRLTPTSSRMGQAREQASTCSKRCSSACRYLAKPNDNMQLTPSQFAIRVDEHERTMRGLVREILRKAGYLPSSWGDPDQAGGQATATEIQSRTEQTERTWSRKNPYDRSVPSRMGSVALELDGILFPGKGGGRYDLNVVFPDLSRTDPKAEAETIGLLNVAGPISTETAVRRANTPAGTTPPSLTRLRAFRPSATPSSRPIHSASTASITTERSNPWSRSATGRSPSRSRP